MTISGTISQAVPTIRAIYDRAFRRAGVANQMITSEGISIAKDLLNALLSELPATGVSLWVQDNIILGMQAGVPQVVTPAGTVEVDRAMIRTQTITTGTVSGATSSWTADLGSGVTVAAQYIGVKVSAAGIYTIAIDTSPDNSTWTQVDTTEYQEFFANKWNWIEVIPDTASVRYFRLRETNSATIPVTAMCVSVEGTEKEISEIAQDDYSRMQNKRLQGIVTMYWEDRQVDGPVLNLYRAPNTDHESYQLVVWRKRQVKDVGSMSLRAEIPQRWIDALSWDLAWRLASELPEATKNPSELKAIADGKMNDLRQAESDGTSTVLAPDISMYTA